MCLSAIWNLAVRAVECEWERGFLFSDSRLDRRWRRFPATRRCRCRDHSGRGEARRGAAAESGRRAWTPTSSWTCCTVRIRWRWSSIASRMKFEVRKCSSIRRVLRRDFLWFFEFWVFFFCLFVFADKDRELSEAQAEIKALKLSERLREKAVEEVNANFFNYYSLLLFFVLLIDVFIWRL